MSLFYRTCLQSRGLLDQSLSLVKDSDGTVLLPILPSRLSQLDLQSLRNNVASDCDITWSQVNTTAQKCFYSLSPAVSLTSSQSLLQSRKTKGKPGVNNLQKFLQELLESHGERWMQELEKDLPRSFQRHGDLILLGDNCFTLPLWKKIGTCALVQTEQSCQVLHHYYFYYY